jgi:hypothetical protein
MRARCGRRQRGAAVRERAKALASQRQMVLLAGHPDAVTQRRRVPTRLHPHGVRCMCRRHAHCTLDCFDRAGRDDRSVNGPFDEENRTEHHAAHTYTHILTCKTHTRVLLKRRLWRWCNAAPRMFATLTAHWLLLCFLPASPVHRHQRQEDRIMRGHMVRAWMTALVMMRSVTAVQSVARKIKQFKCVAAGRRLLTRRLLRTTAPPPSACTCVRVWACGVVYSLCGCCRPQTSMDCAATTLQQFVRKRWHTRVCLLLGDHMHLFKRCLRRFMIRYRRKVRCQYPRLLAPCVHPFLQLAAVGLSREAQH